MRAIQVTEFGGPEVLVATELPDPEPGDGEVLIDVSAAGVSRPETMLPPQVNELLNLIAAGELRAIVGATYPLSEGAAPTRTCAGAGRSASSCSTRRVRGLSKKSDVALRGPDRGCQGPHAR